MELAATNSLTTESKKLDTRSKSKPQKDRSYVKHWAQENVMKSGMQWTVSSIREKTASDGMPMIWTITLQHLRQISLERKLNP